MTALLLTSALFFHTGAELSDWFAGWLATPETSDIKLAQLDDMRERHPCFPQVCQPKEVMPTDSATGATVNTPPPANSGMGSNVEQWRSLVAAYFPAALVELALQVAKCESGGDPTATNPSSGAAGLFQHMPRYWGERSSAAGWTGADIYDPTANVAVAAWLATTDGWHHWNPSRGCW